MARIFEDSSGCSGSPPLTQYSSDDAKRISKTPRPRVPSYLYLKGNIYYFRYALPKTLQKVLGGVEIRCSLRTAYLRKAKFFADKLYNAMKEELRNTMLSLREIKKRMAALAAQLAELQGDYFGSVEERWPYSDIEKLPAPQLRDKQKAIYQDKKLQKEVYEEWVADKCYHALSDSTDMRKYEEIISKPFCSEAFFSLYTERHSPFLINEGYFSQEELNSNKAIIGKALMQLCLMFNEYVVADEAGNAVEAQKILSDYIATAVPPGVPLYSPEAPAKRLREKVLFSQAAERYISTKLKENAWKDRNVRDIRGRLGNFIDIIGDKFIEDITRTDMRIFVETLQKLPPNRSKSKLYAGKSVAEILDMRPEQTLNVATVNTILEAVGSLLEWFVNEGVLEKNPAKGLQIKDSRQAIELRDAFTCDELEKIFAHPKFSKGKFKSASYFWIPLIALFTGARLEEIAQLHCTDLYRNHGSEGLWVFDINDAGKDEAGHGKSLKNRNAKRIIPIHKALLDIGLLDYHARTAKAKHIRLFPDLKITANTSKLGKQPGKQFKAVVVAVLGDAAEKKSFHSLRHTFSDFYKQRGWQTDMFRQLYGHELPHLAANQYGSKFPPDLLYCEVIEKLDYGLSLLGLAPPSK